MATYTIDKIQYNNGDTYLLQDSGALQLTGGSITGPVNFGDSVTMNEATLSELTISGAATIVNNLQVSSINGVAVGNTPKFTDTTYSSLAAASGGTSVSLVTTGEKYTWNNKTSNTGTVTSVQVQASTPLVSSTSTAATTTLNTTISFAKQNANTVLAGPSSGTTTVAPTFRALVAADIPNLAWSKITTGNDDLKAIEALTGTSGLLKKTAANTWTLDTNSYVTSSGVTSITLTQGDGISIGSSGTAITSTGTRTISLANNYGDTKNPYKSKTKNYVLAAPSTGDGVPGFRALVADDLPHDSNSIPESPTNNKVPTSLAVQTAIDNIQIGGRNYLRNTGTFLGWEEVVASGSSIEEDDPIIIDTDEGIAYFPTYTKNMLAMIQSNNNVLYSYLRNKTVSISAQVKGTSGQSLCIIMRLYLTDGIKGTAKRYRDICMLPTGNTSNSSTTTFSANGSWQKIYATFTLSDSFFNTGSSITITDETYFGANICRLNTNWNEFQIRYPKAEIGNKITDWLPAIEDSGRDILDNSEKDNLLSGKMYKFGVTNNVIVAANGGYYTGMWCEVKGGKTYTISRKADNGKGITIYWSEEKPTLGVSVTQLNVLKSPKKNGSFTHQGSLQVSVKVPISAKYLFLRVNNMVPACRYDYNIKVQEGNLPTSWKHAQADLIATPQMFGAIADGATDDTQAIQKALDSGANVFFPNGVYLISYPLIIRNNCHVYGNGPMSRLRAANGFSRSNIPHGSTASTEQLATYTFMTSSNHQTTGVSYMLNYIDCCQTVALGICESISSSLILENLQLDCNYTSSTTNNSTVGGIRIMCSYNAGNIKNIVVTNCATRGIYVGDQSSFTTLKSKYSSTSSVSYQKSFYDYFHNTSNIKDQTDWLRKSRSQSLQVSNCLFQAGSIPTTASVTNPLGYFYNALELNLVDTKFLLQSRGSNYHNISCLYLNYSTDAYIRGCSFTNGKIAVHLDNSCRYFRLIGNTYERIPTATQGAASSPALSGCYCVKVSGTSDRHALRGIIMEVPYSEINSSVRLEYADKIQVIGGFTTLSQANSTNNVLNSWLTSW